MWIESPAFLCRANTDFLPIAYIAGLQPGIPVTVPIVIVAEDGVTSLTYSVQILRDVPEGNETSDAADVLSQLWGGAPIPDSSSSSSSSSSSGLDSSSLVLSATSALPSTPPPPSLPNALQAGSEPWNLGLLIHVCSPQTNADDKSDSAAHLPFLANALDIHIIDSPASPPPRMLAKFAHRGSKAQDFTQRRIPLLSFCLLVKSCTMDTFSHASQSPLQRERLA